MKIHCAELVEGAMRSALEGARPGQAAEERPGATSERRPATSSRALNAGASAPAGGVKIATLLEDDSETAS